MIHYFSDGEWIPESIEEPRIVAFEPCSMKILKYGSEDDFKMIFTNLVSLNYAPTAEDKKVIDWFLDDYDVTQLLPAEIPFKETLAHLFSKGVDVPVKTVTDVLRIAAYMSWGDTEIKLPSKYIKESPWSRKKVLNPEYTKRKFKSFSKKEVHRLLGLLENTNCDKHEMAVYKGRWIRLGERLHPGKYRKQYPKTFNCFDYIRNAKHPRTWMGLLDRRFKENTMEGVKLLASRPGEFARKLDALIRNHSVFINNILDQFLEISDKLPVRMLISLYMHFLRRTEEQKVRRIVTNGKSVDLPVLPTLHVATVNKILQTIEDSMIKIFSHKEKIEPCLMLDWSLTYLPVPYNMRDVEAGTTIVPKGARIKVGDNAKTLRMYLHWTADVKYNALDLSAAFIDVKNVEVEYINYASPGYKLKDFAVHSGDVRHIVGNNAEYIDVDIEKARAAGYKYVILYAHDYEGLGFEHWNAVVGFMEREHPEHNPLWYPKTVTNAMKLSKGTGMIVLAYDLETREYITINQPADGLPTLSATNKQEFLKTVDAYLKPPAFSVDKLIKLHEEAGVCKIVENVDECPEDAGIIHIAADDFINNYEKLVEWL
jgi:hypothetical protein